MNPQKFTQKSFKNWLAKQPDDREFNYREVTACLFASAIKEITGSFVICGGTYYRIDGNAATGFPNWMIKLNDFIENIDGLVTVLQIKNFIKKYDN